MELTGPTIGDLPQEYSRPQFYKAASIDFFENSSAVVTKHTHTKDNRASCADLDVVIPRVVRLQGSFR